ncbi:MAG: MarR family transcriptional regulator [Myxococcales bacterium]|nr:MarR family transcriptional regulator [Myxococcales bacterium]
MSWTFFTNHAHVLFCLAHDPEMRLRDVAVRVGITERAAQRIVAELQEAGYLVVEREGRRNTYQVESSIPLRHPVEEHVALTDILDVVVERPRSRKGAARKS